MVGKWQNLSMSLTLLDKDSAFEVPEGKWEETLSIKPIVTTFYKDGTFKAAYFSLRGTLLFSTKGTWKVDNDSLFLTTINDPKYPDDKVTTAYKITINGNVGTFEGLIDWDEDGNNNELYFGKQEKVE